MANQTQKRQYKSRNFIKPAEEISEEIKQDVEDIQEISSDFDIKDTEESESISEHVEDIISDNEEYIVDENVENNENHKEEDKLDEQEYQKSEEVCDKQDKSCEEPETVEQVSDDSKLDDKESEDVESTQVKKKRGRKSNAEKKQEEVNNDDCEKFSSGGVLNFNNVRVFGIPSKQAPYKIFNNLNGEIIETYDDCVKIKYMRNGFGIVYGYVFKNDVD